VPALSETRRRLAAPWLALVGTLLLLTCGGASAGAQVVDPNPNPPAQTTKLIFVRHSCGENWLSDDDGGLGLALSENHYFVSDTNYGWGPDNIGDRTDITDWQDWFTGPDSGRYLAALYRENGQNARYTRTLPDPGGENQVILFKSCFPNSNLEGGPYDPPARGDSLTVSNAKAIYYELLTYFVTRPDKLFVAITAPPVRDPTYAANARAFNTWLVTEWLRGYPENNVAVFDYYNVLTDRDNHHRYHAGVVEYVTDRGRDNLAFPTSDDHPSRAGNRKATEEFVPLLNVYVNHWLAAAARVKPLPTPAATPTTGDGDSAPPMQPTSGEIIIVADMESAVVEWSAFADDTGRTWVHCQLDAAQAHSGAAALAMEYQVAAEGWASCSLVFPGPQDWSAGTGLVLHLHAEEAGVRLVVVAYGGAAEALQHFEFRTETTQAAVDGWQRVEARWEELLPPAWEDGSARFDPARSMGLALLFEGSTGGQSGRLWLDDATLLTPAPTDQTAAPTSEFRQPAPTLPETPEAEAEPAGGQARPGVCPGAGLLVLATGAGAGLAGVRERRRGR